MSSEPMGPVVVGVAQLVVVGSSRHHGLPSLMRSPIRQAMVDLAGCPVAVVPQD